MTMLGRGAEWAAVGLQTWKPFDVISCSSTSLARLSEKDFVNMARK